MGQTLEQRDQWRGPDMADLVNALRGCEIDWCGSAKLEIEPTTSGQGFPAVDIRVLWRFSHHGPDGTYVEALERQWVRGARMTVEQMALNLITDLYKKLEDSNSDPRWFPEYSPPAGISLHLARR